MEIRQLELFLAVMECASVTKAAERVYLSPGAVSMQLQNLAEELNTELFVRSHRRFVPTPAALKLAGHARAVLDHVRQIEQEFEDDPSKDTRTFHFATGTTTLIHCLGKPLRRLRAKYPNVDFQVTVSVTEDMVNGLLNRRFDLALISLPYPEAGLTMLPLYEEELLVLRPSARRVRGNAVTNIRPSEMANVPFLLYPSSSNMRVIINNYFHDLGLNPRVILEADDTEAIKGLVEAGFGYSILPERALRGRPHFYQMCRVAGRRLARTQALAMAKTEFPRALARSIAAYLQSELAAK